MERFIIFSVFISVFIVSCNESRDTISKIEMERYTECPIGEISQIALQGSGDYEINVDGMTEKCRLSTEWVSSELGDGTASAKY